MQGVDWKPAVLVTAGLLIVGNSLSSYYSSRDAAPRPRTLARPTAELQVISSSQSADGATEADFNATTAANLERYAAGRIAAKLDALAKQAGLSLPSPQIRTESTVVKVLDRRLIVIRYEINSSSRGVEVLGITGANLNRVVCARETLDEILISAGPCADKIREVHGVDFGRASRS